MLQGFIEGLQLGYIEPGLRVKAGTSRNVGPRTPKTMHEGQRKSVNDL